MAGSIAHHLPQDWIYNRQALFYTFPKCLVLSSLLCGSNIIHISEMGKLRHRKFKDIVQIPGLLNGRDEPRRSDSGAHILYLSEQRNKPHMPGWHTDYCSSDAFVGVPECHKLKGHKCGRNTNVLRRPHIFKFSAES